jgi:hypothetical protein
LSGLSLSLGSEGIETIKAIKVITIKVIAIAAAAASSCIIHFDLTPCLRDMGVDVCMYVHYMGIDEARLRGYEYEAV